MTEISQPSLIYPWGDYLPEFGHLHQVHDGVYWLRLPLPFALDHINVWLLRDHFNGQEGWTLVDTGVACPEQKEIWLNLFEKGLEGLPIVRVIVTHMHPDHVGLAGWHCDHWQAPLWMSMTDYMMAALWVQPPSDSNPMASQVGQATALHFQRHGYDDPELLAAIRKRDSFYPGLVSPLPNHFHRLMHGDQVDINGDAWQVIVGYGHAPEHVSLWSAQKNVLISGDMVLPRISTNVSVHAFEPEANPLTLYLDSLSRYEAVDEQALVLPSHGRPFYGLHLRIAQQHQHHAERLQETHEACRRPQGLTAAELVPLMFQRCLDVHQLGFAMGEALAHLHALYYQGKLERRLVDGVYRFYAHSA